MYHHHANKLMINMYEACLLKLRMIMMCTYYVLYDYMNVTYYHDSTEIYIYTIGDSCIQ